MAEVRPIALQPECRTEDPLSACLAESVSPPISMNGYNTPLYPIRGQP